MTFAPNTYGYVDAVRLKVIFIQALAIASYNLGSKLNLKLLGGYLSIRN